jgi:hypothetical protein
MPSRRTPLKRHHRSLISDSALDAFRELKDFEKVATPESHERWWLLHSRLCDEVSDRKLWEWPFVVSPENACKGDEAAAARWLRFSAALEASDKVS